MVLPAPGLAKTGYVVAGGESRRMGRDKASLPFEGRTLLDHAIARLSAVAEDVKILCGPQPRYPDRDRSLVLDRRPGEGPLGGLLAGLGDLEDGFGIFLAVDLPYVPIGLLAFLVSELGGFDAAVPVTANGPEPLCAVYAASCAAAVTRHLDRGERKMTSFWDDVRVKQLPGEAFRPFGDVSQMFRNWNAPGDL